MCSGPHDYDKQWLRTVRKLVATIAHPQKSYYRWRHEGVSPPSRLFSLTAMCAVWSATDVSAHTLEVADVEANDDPRNPTKCDVVIGHLTTFVSLGIEVKTWSCD